MASIIPVGTNKVRAQIRRAGHPAMTKTFTMKTIEEAKIEAGKWVRKNEVEIDEGKKVGVHGKTGVTVAEAVQRYMTEKEADLARMPMYILKTIQKNMGHLRLDKLTDDDIVAYIKARNFSAASGGLHFSYIGTVLKVAKFGWKYHVPEILDAARERMKFLSMIGPSKERTRRPTKEEIAKLLAFKFPESEIPMADIIQFAMATAMRQAEITRIEHSTYKQYNRTVIIEDRKHPKKKKGNHKTVPLTAEAIEIINRQVRKEGDERIFPFAPTTIGNYFSIACEKLGIDDLHFHDLRHEGTSRLFEMGYQVHEVQMFTGHEDLKTLQRYMHLKAEDVRRIETATVEKITAQPMAFEMDAATMEQFKMFQMMQAMMKQQQAA